MSQRNFRALLDKKWDEGKFLCVGLDSDFESIPEWIRKGSVRESIVAFNRGIVDATKDLVCSYKPNSAFYEAWGDEGYRALRETIQYINDQAPDVPVVLDAKRGDIGNTNSQYAQFAFDHLHADAITVHPYFGSDALQPFFDRKDKGIIVLCRSSNPGAGEIQSLQVGDVPLYQTVATMTAGAWNRNGNTMIMVGATNTDDLAAVRRIVVDMPILIPGIGAQGGDLEKTVASGKDSRGRGMIICASRAVIFASLEKDFAEAAREKVIELNGAISKAL